MADKVMSSPQPTVQTQPEEEQQPSVQAKGFLQTRPMEEKKEDAGQNAVLAKEEEKEEVATKQIQRQEKEEPEVQKNEDEEQVQSQADKEQVDRQAEEEESVQAQAEQEETVSKQSENEEESSEGAVQTQGEEEEVSRQEEEEEVQTKSSSPKTAPDGLESTLAATKTGGAPLPSETRSQMEPHFGSDFSGVKVHTDSTAVQMSKDLNAQAFTHGNHVYFGEGKYSPGNSDGQRLIAHELTHVVQQGAAAPAKASSGSTATNVSAKTIQPQIQRSWLGDAWDAVSGAASSAVGFVTDSLSSGLNWVKDKFKDFAHEIPGYTLLTVVLGQDPITGAPVARNGRNFIEGAVTVIPLGILLRRKLEETGAFEEAGAWLDEQIANLDISLSDVLASLAAFWRSLSLTDITDPGGVLSRAANIIRKPVSQVVNFAIGAARTFLRIIKKFALSELVKFVRDHTRGYPLLTVILGKDPITEEPVERNGMNLIRGFLMLSADGEEQLQQMEETGSLQRAADWIDGAVARLDLSWETIRSIFTQAWNLVTIENLMNPVETYMQLVGLFLEPAARIVRFVVEVGLKVLEFIKDALIRKLVAFARGIPGYVLLTVFLGKDPFSEEPVPRTPENIIHGFMNLIPGGEAQFQQMKQTGAIQRTVDWIEGAVARLGFTWEFIKNLFLTAWNSFSLKDLAAPFEAFGKIMALFKEPISRLFTFVKDVIFKIIEILLIMMNFPTNLVMNIITKSIQAYKDIMRNPIEFLKNILKAIKQGFVQFFSNILKHLLGGLTGWLFGQLKDVGINPPQDLSLKSILGFVMEILGITMEKIWKKIGDRIGHDKVEKIKAVIDKVTGIWAFVRDVMTRGPVAIWEYIVEKISDLWSIVLEHVRNWVITKIITQVTVKLLGLLDPTGIMAVVNSVIALYKAIQSFVQYLREMLEVVNSFVEGVAEIAKGDVKRAADFLEGAMARSMPIVIGFLANQVGLGNVGRKIGEMVKAVQAKIDAALDWLIDKAVKAGTGFLNLLKRGVSAVKEGVASLFKWWKIKKAFKSKDGQSHGTYFKGQGKGAKLMVASREQVLEDFLRPGGEAEQRITGPTQQAALLQARADFQTIRQRSATLDQLGANSTQAQRAPHMQALDQAFASMTNSLGQLNFQDSIPDNTPSPVTDSFLRALAKGLVDQWRGTGMAGHYIGNKAGGHIWVRLRNPQPGQRNFGISGPLRSGAAQNFLTTARTTLQQQRLQPPRSDMSFTGGTNYHTETAVSNIANQIGDANNIRSASSRISQIDVKVFSMLVPCDGCRGELNALQPRRGNSPINEIYTANVPDGQVLQSPWQPSRPPVPLTRSDGQNYLTARNLIDADGPSWFTDLAIK